MSDFRKAKMQEIDRLFLKGVQARATGGWGRYIHGEVHRCGVSEGDLKKVYPKKRPGTKAQPLESYICHRGNQEKQMSGVKISK